MRRGSVERVGRRFFRRWVRPLVGNDLYLQRIKLIWFGWGYWRLLWLENCSLLDRLYLLYRFIRVDFNILHSHRPSEIVQVCLALFERRARNGEIVVEAGSWKGGSSAKFSILCKLLNYDLWIFDSFQGVERINESGFSFAGEYAVTRPELLDNLTRFGEIKICHIVEGWFSETLSRTSVPRPVRVAYIDCDLAKATREVLQGVVPMLVPDGQVFSQDYHLAPVRLLLHDPRTWSELGVPLPVISPLCGNLASIRFVENGHVFVFPTTARGD